MPLDFDPLPGRLVPIPPQLLVVYKVGILR